MIKYNTKALVLKNTANFLTFTRVAGAAVIAALSVNSRVFWVVYLLCGATDIMDGYFARRFNTETNFGEKLDSAADLLFFCVCAAKILPSLSLAAWIWLWSAVIAAAKITSYVLRRIKGRFESLHTSFNKLTGTVIFILAPLLFKYTAVSSVVMCVTASLAAVYDLHCALTNKK